MSIIVNDWMTISVNDSIDELWQFSSRDNIKPFPGGYFGKIISFIFSFLISMIFKILITKSIINISTFSSNRIIFLITSPIFIYNILFV